ncbi:group II intron reverse transcriptase/maturase [Marinimicrobium sp. C6131]|uniref:group II intron reverse transcriptase/maturase n=1 Tax=Marinimicrobium sp. C6131 TaxID=3022676 RepID=UPI00223D36C3|nr:group II intron reverse transcriptase/maturase [Marinimicrobium sp. C6131]UZJ46254.1 group II intron reverse transcriptase/maturase [Marinimicrobium sp. C6131]UZJ46284.1 group II intron reverse transcriptase/maturase [Marinimicrobium sp. C6131]
MNTVRHQMPAPAGRVAQREGEALAKATSDETGLPRQESEGAGRDLLVQALARENMQRAWKRVKANKGSAGVDGLDIAQSAEHLRWAWPALKQQLLEGTYRPQPVRRVGLPKPDGSERELGIPTVTDRLIQQALLQVLQPLIDPTFSEHSHGFRPGRRAHDAVLAAQRYAQQGRHIVVDVDLSKFFDRVNHDILIDRLKKRVNDPGVIRLVRAYLNAGIMDGGVVMERHEGTPQGGPLSPLLANVLLDEVDKELERRGHCFARYADDCNVYVRSYKAGERVMRLLRRCYKKLRLVINETKSAVTSVFGRKFLGYALWQTREGEVRRAVSAKAVQAFKLRVRQLTRGSVGRSMEQVVETLCRYLLGWKGYFRLAQTPRIWRSLDKWIRRRLRALQLRQWRRGKTIYRELLRLGAKPEVAQSVAALSRRWWHNSLSAIHTVQTVAYFDRLGVPRLA